MALAWVLANVCPFPEPSIGWPVLGFADAMDQTPTKPADSILATLSYHLVVVSPLAKSAGRSRRAAKAQADDQQERPPPLPDLDQTFRVPRRAIVEFESWLGRFLPRVYDPARKVTPLRETSVALDGASTASSSSGIGAKLELTISKAPTSLVQPVPKHATGTRMKSPLAGR